MSLDSGDTVTMTVKDYIGNLGGFNQLSLMISSAEQPGLLDANPKYEWEIRWDGGTYKYRVRKDVGTGSYELFTEVIGATFTGPVKLDIVRNGANYEFYANDVLKYTASSYSSAVHDSMVYYQIILGGQGNETATVDDFGVPAAPASTPGTLIYGK